LKKKLHTRNWKQKAVYDVVQPLVKRSSCRIFLKKIRPLIWIHVELLRLYWNGAQNHIHVHVFNIFILLPFRIFYFLFASCFIAAHIFLI
jgi:hypothetical protein